MKQLSRYILPVMGLLIILTFLRAPDALRAFDYERFSRLPVLLDGRIQPMDTVARNSLLILSSKSTPRIEIDGSIQKLLPSEWLATVLFEPEVAYDWPLIRIYSEELKDDLGLSLDRKDFSFNELRPFFTDVERQADAARVIEMPRRNAYQRANIKLYDKLILYLRLSRSIWTYDQDSLSGEWDTFTEYLQDPSDSAMKQLFVERYSRMAELSLLRVSMDAQANFEKIGESQLASLESRGVNAMVDVYLRLAGTFRDAEIERFNSLVIELERVFEAYGISHKSDVEAAYNTFNPLYRALGAYLLAGIFVCVGWAFWPDRFLPAATWMLVLALILHTSGLLLRMYIQGRPPVTNLYSSAVFVGWGAALFGLVLEWRSKQGLGAITAAAIGFSSLVVAQGLAASGDTLEQMQAVLDSNFWLATHVVTITLGYSATFLAGFIGIAYVVRLYAGSATRAFVRNTANLAFSVSLFALLLSFVGTVLGGIWADQSWGRFWGWDPKENGAVMIVIWNAVILHVKLSGMLRDHGLLIAVIFGNVITAFSWFGVNMLGIGLHSYGFMDEAFFWLLLFCGVQVSIIFLGAVRNAFLKSNKSVLTEVKNA